MNENTAIGVAAFIHSSKTLEERGVAVYYVKLNGIDVPQFRPMTPAELALRKLKITVTDGDGNFIRNDHGAEKLR